MNALRNKDAMELTELVSLRTLQKIQDFCSEAFKIPLSVRDLNGNLITKVSNGTKLWQIVYPLIKKENKDKKTLLEAFEKSKRTGQIAIMERYLDTKAFAAPIHINGKIKAFFVGGLVRLGNPDIEKVSQEAAYLKIDLDEYLDAYLQLSLFTNDQLEAAANLLKIISSTITGLEFEGNEIRNKTEQIIQQNQELANHLENKIDELNQNQTKYEIIFQTINDGVYVADMQGTLLDINPAGAKILGYEKPEDIIGKPLQDLYLDPNDRNEFNRRVLEYGHIENWIANIKKGDGKTQHIETNSILVRDKKGNPKQIHGIFRDIEQRLHRNIK